MKIIFSKDAEEFLKKKSFKSKEKLNLVFHAKELSKSCYLRIEPDISFETDENYLEGIDKYGEWGDKIEIFIDPVIKPLLQKRNEIKVSLQGKFFKKLVVASGKQQVKLQCSIK